MATCKSWPIGPARGGSPRRARGDHLQAEHWEILELLRRFYDEFQLSPANRPLIKYVAQQLGPEKGNSLHLNHLFKGAPAKLAAKLAGLPKPTIAYDSRRPC